MTRKDAPDVSEDTCLLNLDEFFPYHLRRAYALASSRLRNVYEGVFGLTTGEWRVLAILVRDGDVTNRHIVSTATIDKVAASRAITKLADKGFVERHPNPEDGRSELLRCSEQGLDMYRRLSPDLLKVEKDLLGNLNEDEQQTLRALLEKVARR